MLEKEAQNIMTAGYLAGYMNKEAGFLDQFIRPNKYVGDLQDKYPKSLIPVKPRGTDLSDVVSHISSDITADLGDKLRGKKFELGDKTSLTELLDPEFIKRLPVRTSLAEKVDKATSKVIKEAPQVVAPPTDISDIEKTAMAGYYAGYMMDKEAAWYNDAIKGVKDWWGKRSDTEKDLITAGGGALAGGAIGAGLGGWKGAVGGALGGAGLAYGGRKGYNYLTTPDKETGISPWASWWQKKQQQTGNTQMSPGMGSGQQTPDYQETTNTPVPDTKKSLMFTPNNYTPPGM